MRLEIFIASMVAVVYIILALWYLKSRDKGSKKMQEVSGIIKRGSKIFLKREHKYLSIVILILGITLFVLDKVLGTFFIVGAVLSSFSSIIGMSVATSANVKVAASKSIQSGMRIAFLSGLIVSTFTTLIGLLGIYAMYSLTDNVQTLYGFDILLFEFDVICDFHSYPYYRFKMTLGSICFNNISYKTS